MVIVRLGVNASLPITAVLARGGVAAVAPAAVLVRIGGYAHLLAAMHVLSSVAGAAVATVLIGTFLYALSITAYLIGTTLNASRTTVVIVSSCINTNIVCRTNLWAESEAARASTVPLSIAVTFNAHTVAVATVVVIACQINAYITAGTILWT
jgi:hypothetical protein